MSVLVTGGAGFIGSHLVRRLVADGRPGALDPAVELKRFIYKVEAGAEFAVTQPVFDVAQLERFLREIDGVRIPVVAGIWPLVSARNAEFLANEVPGVVVPESILQRMRKANDKSREHAVAEGITIASEMLSPRCARR